jgi:hypothetical protein
MPMTRVYREALFCFVLGLIMSCNQNDKSPGEKNAASKTITKPGASGTDSLAINAPALIFFEPDSIQLEKIKKVTEQGVFKSNVHEYEFQSYTAKMYAKKYRPDLKTFEAKNFRYIVFIKSDKSRKVIDLDKIADTWGMYVFDPNKEPQLSDMMSVDTEIPRYFSK